MGSFAGWLSSTALSLALKHQEGWLWPLCETLHFIGLSLLVGIAGFFDLRLIGFMKRIPIRAVEQFMPWAIVGFAINLLTGIVFLIAEPRQYAENVAWWAKVFFLIMAGLNAMLFQTTLSARIAMLPPGEDTPLSFKIVGAVSLITWLGVLYFGRMMPFLDVSSSTGL
jgi:hypothetical protein